MRDKNITARPADSQLVATADIESLTKALFSSLDINEATRQDYETRPTLTVNLVISKTRYDRANPLIFTFNGKRSNFEAKTE